MYLSRNIRYLRKKKGINQSELSRRVGKTHSAISSYEQGKAEPTAGVLMKIAEALEVSLDDLLYKDLTESDQILSQTENMLAYAEKLEEGTMTVDEVYDRVGEANMAKINRLLEQRVNELERAIKQENPELAKALKID